MDPSKLAAPPAERPSSRPERHWIGPIWLAAFVLAAGCDDAAGPDPVGLELEIAGGDQQTGPAGTPLPVPLRVKVTRDGVPEPAVRVAFEASTASAEIAPSTVATVADGIAEATYTLGGPGPQTIRVRVPDTDLSIDFTATAVEGPYPSLVGAIPIPPNYGIHDTFVRDGIAFVSAWNTGVIIYDVGDGRGGGSPSHPVEISRIVTGTGTASGGPAVHNTWWFHNPVSDEKRYLFVGQEGPARIADSSSGDLHVVDVSDLAAPEEVATLAIPGAGIHNVWMDEEREILYAAYYNAGVVALDVSGTLSGDLSSRIIARRAIGGAGNTYTWGVMLAGGSLWASDMKSGFWRLDPTNLQSLGGGNNVPERWGADLWVHGSYGYTGTWGGFPRTGATFGDAVKIWQVDGAGPVLVDSLVIPDIRTVSDLEVSDDGRILTVTTERLGGQGLHVYDLTDPRKPASIGFASVATGLHTGTLARIGGRLYVFAAKNPDPPALQIYDITPEP